MSQPPWYAEPAVADRVDPRHEPAVSSPDPPRSVYLHSGQIHASAEPVAVTTIVGSCIAVCLWDRHAAIGGINHYLMPRCTNGQISGLDRFGEAAIPHLIAAVRALGASPRYLVAKVFGGANVIGGTAPRGVHVGTQNADLAFDMLRDARIPIMARDVGGARGRKLLFQTADGVVRLKRL